jgi:hypothetical protein
MQILEFFQSKFGKDLKDEIENYAALKNLKITQIAYSIGTSPSGISGLGNTQTHYALVTFEEKEIVHDYE